jgi:hypothetical protein
MHTFVGNPLDVLFNLYNYIGSRPQFICIFTYVNQVVTHKNLKIRYLLF